MKEQIKHTLLIKSSKEKITHVAKLKINEISVEFQKAGEGTENIKGRGWVC